jgi:hypothetical protein
MSFSPKHVRSLRIAAAHHFIERKLGTVICRPMPSVLECLDLGVGLFARRGFEKNVIRAKKSSRPGVGA